MRKMCKKRGFTLAELLIVIAILGVLVAVAIPVFTSSLEKTRETVCLANLTSSQHLLAVMEMTEGLDEGKAKDAVATGVGALDKLCPSGGTYIFEDKSALRDGTSWVVKCTKHGMTAVEVVKLDPTKILDASKVTEYFSSGRNGLDSTGPNFGQDGRKAVADAVGTTQAFDFHIDKDGAKYHIYVSEQLPEKSSVSGSASSYEAWSVTKYTIANGTVSEKKEGTVPLYVKALVENGTKKEFVVMNASAFKENETK